MSGPKVVRVITKQEVIAICRGRIDTLQDTIAQWRKFATKHDALTAEEETSVEKRLSAIIKMFENEQFNDVQKKCNDEISSLKRDVSRIREAAIVKAVQERSTRRRLQYSAETLIKFLETEKHQIPEELLNITSSIITADEAELTAINSTLCRILNLYILGSNEIQTMTPLQKELSKKLSEGEKLQTLADWKINHSMETKETEANQRLDKLLAEIECLNNEVATKKFVERLTFITKEPSSNQRSLLTDSLIIDLIEYSKEQKEIDNALESMREIHSELKILDSLPAQNLEKMFVKAIETNDLSLIKNLTEKGIELIKIESKYLLGMARREAVLKGLSELGYEIRESMATAWVKNGRLIVKKPNEQNYGVELGAIEEAERMQIQLVSFQESSSSQDIEKETIWCSEFSRLKSLLEKAGSSLLIEKALPVGSKPLKQVKEPSQLATRSDKQSKENVLKKVMKD
ncbi:hypothetical protein [Legionella quateirensis]|uniref:Uncharacterized protein n=1 Tax=Legionella quateirensis TaxID=45072 RepID=A0A378KQW1_9GAMM|nr:hypothetical protein [Legionella quateirensis]KTD47813.1 hypothetical protein Lqua_2206 [Legionella quateirensis]STY16706.1 Uncharacterised protein [Legionella quateirensis]